ncbi:MAG: DUF4136 domain-containing protein [Chitinophagaceae bacterium]
MYRYITYSFFVVLVACGSAKVLNTEKADGVNFTAYKTFDFYKVEAGGDTVSQQFSEQVIKLEDAIALKMQQMGYLLSKTNPDLLINIGAVVREQVQTRQTDFRTDAPRYIGQRRYSWKSEDVEVARYREGTVTVHLVDRKQNKMVWNGVVQDIIPEKESKLDAVIKRGIKKLFADYPASSRQ